MTLKGLEPLLAILLLVLIAGQVQAEIYKWVDENGKVQFSDKPNPLAKSEKIEVKVNTYVAPIMVDDGSRAAEKPKKAKPKKVVMYSAEWCGVCKKAKAYFEKNGIRYKEYDVEKSSKGKRDYKKMKGKGVPIILVGESKMIGFSPSRFQQMYGADGS